MQVKKPGLRNRHGFTLVELMIVVVIMGVLVAVAIPVYNLVTQNAEKKSCHANVEIITKASMQFLLTNGRVNYSEIMGESNEITILDQAHAEEVLPADFLACFEQGTFPECPTDSCHYTLIYQSGGETGTFTVYCSEHGDRFGAAQP